MFRRIAAYTIAQMRVKVAFNGHDASGVALVESVTIRQDSTQAISTCGLTIFQAYGISRYDVARYSEAAFVYQWLPQEWDQVILWDEDGQILFGGFVLSVQRRTEGPHVKFELGCSDWGMLFERRLITQAWPAGTPDSTIVADTLRLVPEITAGVIVTQIGNVGAIEVKDFKIRDLLDDICELTGSEWNVSYDGKLNYYRQGSILAPFALSDRPNGVTTVGYQLDDYASDFSDAANRVLVLGAMTDTGEIRAEAVSGPSQAQYGILSITLVDRSLTDLTTAQVWAQTEVAQRAFPKPTVAVSIFRPGLTRGMTVEIEAVKYGLAQALILRTLTIVIAAPDRARQPVAGHTLKYTAVLGTRPPDLVYTLRRMQRRPVEPTQVPLTPVPPGSIGPGDFAQGIAPVFLVSQKPQGAEWNLYPLDAVFLNTTDKKLYRRIGNDWTAVVNAAEIEGQLQTHQLAPGSVTSTVLADGSVVTAKIPAGAITAPQLGPGAVTPPALAPGAVTGPAIAASAVTANAIAANAILAQHLTAGAVTADAIAANSIAATHVSAGAITATALAAGSVTANAVAANAIYAQALQANSVTAIALAANSVVAGKIAALAVVAGNLAADAVTAGTVSAGAVRAGNLAAGAVTAGTIAAGAVTADSIAAFQIQSYHLAVNSVTANAIAAGTIDSSKLSTFEIAVGFGGGKPGRVGVYDGFQQLTALIGDLGGSGSPAGTYGVWARRCAFGGTWYGDAPMYTDGSSNLFLRQINLTITAFDSSSIATSPTTFDPSYGSIALNITKPGDSQTALVSRGIVLRNSINQVVGAFVRSPANQQGELTLYGAGGLINVLIEGSTGRIRANGFDPTGFAGQTETMTISGVQLRFVGGVYVGH